MALAPGNDSGLPRFTLKDANVFLQADALGDIDGGDSGPFSDDTCMLSRLQRQLARSRPSLLGAAVSQDNVLFVAHLVRCRPRRAVDPRGRIHRERGRLI